LESHAIEEVSDFYVEIIEAYVAVGEYAKALYLCDVIMGSVEVNVFNVPHMAHTGVVPYNLGQRVVSAW
jgi:hypothetical protein